MPLETRVQSPEEVIESMRFWERALSEVHSDATSANNALRFELYDALLVLQQLAQSVSCMVTEGPDVLKPREVYANVLGDAKKALDFLAAKHPWFEVSNFRPACVTCKYNKLTRKLSPCSACNGPSRVNHHNLWEGEDES